jgi:hypothetical protein
MSFRVLVDDHFRSIVQGRRYAAGEYATRAEALAVCRETVDRFLRHEYVEGMAASALYFRYIMFGEDPFIVEPPDSAEPLDCFSAWDYARMRCVEMCATRAGTSEACA